MKFIKRHLVALYLCTSLIWIVLLIYEIAKIATGEADSETVFMLVLATILVLCYAASTILMFRHNRRHRTPDSKALRTPDN